MQVDAFERAVVSIEKAERVLDHMHRILAYREGVLVEQAVRELAAREGRLDS
jgi:hypothetical protein